MSEHIHKWRIQHDVDHAFIWCEDYWKNKDYECSMSVEEAERILNQDFVGGNVEELDGS